MPTSALQKIKKIKGRHLQWAQSGRSWSAHHFKSILNSMWISFTGGNVVIAEFRWRSVNVLLSFCQNGGLPCLVFCFHPMPKTKKIFRRRENMKMKPGQFWTAHRLRSEVVSSLTEEPLAPGAGNQSKHSCCRTIICAHILWIYMCRCVHFVQSKTMEEKRRRAWVFLQEGRALMSTIWTTAHRPKEAEDFELDKLFYIQLTLLHVLGLCKAVNNVSWLWTCAFRRSALVHLFLFFTITNCQAGLERLNPQKTGCLCFYCLHFKTWFALTTHSSWTCRHTTQISNPSPFQMLLPVKCFYDCGCWAVTLFRSYVSVSFMSFSS